MNNIQSTSGFAPVHNGKLFYETAGNGPAVLFIHAGVADHTMWHPQIEAFSQDYKVICYDTRGYGKSQTEPTEFSNRQDIIDLMDHLGVERAAVVGISRGGQIAIDFTLEHPERVFALVAVAAGIGGYEFHEWDKEPAKQEFEMFNRMDELWEKKAFDELTDLQVHAWADGPSQPEGRAAPEIRDYMRRVVRMDLERQDSQVNPITLDPPAYTRLDEIKVPTLILIGEYDFQNILAAADELECHIPLARKFGFPKTAHMIPMEVPEKFNQVVGEFLNEVTH